MAADNSSKAYKDALKKIDNMIKKQETLKKTTESLANSWGAVASEIFKMDGAEFFKSVKKTPEELKVIGEKIRGLQSDFETLGNSAQKSLNLSPQARLLTDSLRSAFKDAEISSKSFAKAMLDQIKKSDSTLKDTIKTEEQLKNFLTNQNGLREEEVTLLKTIESLHTKREGFDKSQEDYSKKLNKIYQEQLDIMPELANFNEDIAKSIFEQRASGKEWKEILESTTPEGKKFVAILAAGDEETRNIINGMNELEESIANSRKEAIEMNKVFSPISGFVKGIGKNIMKDWVGSMLKFNEVVNDVQKKFSINMDDNSEAFGSLTREVAQFGMTVEGAGEMMGNMSEKLNTTNFSVLSQATKDFSSVEGATGASADSITDMASQMMIMGQSSSQVKDAMEGADQEARRFGVSSKKVIEGISKNMSRFRNMGFSGGEASLKKMIITAEKLHMSVDSIFNMADKARSIEGAMDMASELQLAGGSFSNINPMDLLAAARKGPQELQKILGKMGKDIGKFNDKGEYEFDPIDADRLKIAADAAGVTVDEFQKMISTNAINAEKLKPFDGLMDGMQEADAELAKSGIADMMKMGEDGKVVFDVNSDMAKKMGVDSMEELQALTGQQIADGMKADKKTLEEQNKRNQSLKESFDNFINAFMSIFSIFEPILSVLTTAIQGITSAFTWIMGGLDKLGMFGTVIKWAIPLMLLFGTQFGASVLSFITKGIGSFLKAPMNMAKGIKRMFGGASEGEDTDAASKAKGPSPGVGGGLKDLSKGLKAMGSDFSTIMKGILAVAASGPAFLLFVPALPGLMSLALIGTVGKQITAGFKAIAKGLTLFGEDTNIYKGIGALMLSVIPLAIFGPASLFLLPLALIGLIGPLITGGFKAISSGIGAMGQNITNIAKGALAMVLVAAGIGAFALVASFMTDVDWMNVLAGVGVMALVTIGLIGLGFLLSGPGMAFLLIGAVGLIAVGASLAIAGAGLLVASMAFQQLGAVDWNAFSGMGSALMTVVPGLLAFSLASMMFMNPLTLIGLVFMVGALSGLAMVMAPLSMSLTLGADSLDRFASGLEKLSAAADKLSLEKLEALKELGDSMAGAGAGGAVMAAMANSAGGSGGGDGEVRKIEIDIKMNGRDVQHTILKDTALLK